MHAAEQMRPDVVEKRRLWEISKGELNPQKLVFIDETATKTNLTQLYGWGPKSERLVDHVPHGHWKTTTLIYGLRWDGIVAPYTIDGAMNREKFLVYLRDVLCPTLTTGDVVICDNLSVHKGPEVVAAIESAGAKILFLPPYSPDQNPIELSFAKLKSILRKRCIRTLPELTEFLLTSPQLFTPSECYNFFTHAGYEAV